MRTVRRAARGAIAAATTPDAAEPARLDLAVRIDRIAGPARARVDVGELATFEVLGAAATSPIDLAWALMSPDTFTDAPPRPGFTVRPLSLGGGGGQVQVAGSSPADVLDRTDVVRGRATLPGIGRAGRVGPVGGIPPPSRDGGTTTTSGHPRAARAPEPPEDPPRPPRPDSPDAAAFRVLAPRHLAEFLAAPRDPGPIRAPIDMGALFDQVIAMTAPATTFAAALGGLLDGSPPAIRLDRTRQHRIRPSPTSVPRFGAPMAAALAELGQEWLLPGLGEVPADTALALRTNSSFVQAFMIGLNHELGRELLWREFPTTLTATFFQRFWDNAIDPAAPVDLDPLADWADRSLDATSAGGERFVLLLRTELLRRFPDALVTAVRGGETILPVFTRRAGPRRALLRLRHPGGRGRAVVDRDRGAAGCPALRLRGRRRPGRRQPRAGR